MKIIRTLETTEQRWAEIEFEFDEPHRQDNERRVSISLRADKGDSLITVSFYEQEFMDAINELQKAESLLSPVAGWRGGE
jgi:hypothetical protein